MDSAVADKRYAKRPENSSIMFHLRTLWLFTRSDIKTVVIPQLAFGVFTAASGNILTTNPTAKLQEILVRIPKVLLWLWPNLLFEVIANQRLSRSIFEDSINKPWRPLPTRRISKAEAKTLQLILIPILYFLGRQFDCRTYSACLAGMSYMYNELDGADKHVILRNLLNAGGIACFSLGAATIAAGNDRHSLKSEAFEWIYILSAIVATTVHTQDLADMDGDKLRGRKTIPLVYGEAFARWSLAVGVLAWSLFCPIYWSGNNLFFSLPVLLGLYLSFNVLLRTTKSDDAMSWKLWCIWIITIYAMPLFRAI